VAANFQANAKKIRARVLGGAQLLLGT
jgi:hypothetical protein